MNKISRNWKLILIASTILVSSVSQAALYTIHDGLSSSYIGGGNAVNGTFNLNSIVPKASYDYYKISSATLVIDLADDSDTYSTRTRHISTSASSVEWGGQVLRRNLSINYYDYYRNQYSNSYTSEESELARVAIGDQAMLQGSDITGFRYNGTDRLPYNRYNHTFTLSDRYCIGYSTYGCTDWYYRYTDKDYYERNIVTNYVQSDRLNGLSLELNAASLRTLATLGSIDYTLDAISGDFLFQNARLVVDVEVVPEPPIFALMGLGFFSLSLFRLKKNNVTLT